MSISILVLTLNEEINLPSCLESVKWSDEIVVFDSFSSDRTVQIAKAHGARVVQRKFDNYAAQRNAALNDVRYKYPWLLMVDADEQWDEKLYTEMSAAIEDDTKDKISIYHFRRKDMFLGKWLKYSLASSTWSGRLVRLGDISVKRKINEEYHTDGRKGFLTGKFVHYPFSKGVAWWLERHNRYSSMEAETLIHEVNEKLVIKMLFSTDPSVRRKFLKQLACRIPCRPLLVFCYLYFFRLGFLDGFAGLTYCRLRAIYEYMIDLKVKE